MSFSWGLATTFDYLEMERSFIEREEGSGGDKVELERRVFAEHSAQRSLRPLPRQPVLPLAGSSYSLMAVTIDSFLSFLELYQNGILVRIPPCLVFAAHPSVCEIHPCCV